MYIHMQRGRKIHILYQPTNNFASTFPPIDVAQRPGQQCSDVSFTAPEGDLPEFSGWNFL